jgi:metal-sulfur cluster biosynthetic enzyme
MNELKEQVVSEIKKIYDPEIPVNIYELGLIYKIEIKEDKKSEYRHDFNITELPCSRKFAKNG